MEYWKLYFLVFLSGVFFISGTNQLPTSQIQLLLQLRKQLEYPIPMQVLVNYSGDLCNLPSFPRITISCKDNSVSELKIMGDKLAQLSEFNGLANPNQTLSDSFSIDSFVTTLSRLTGLRVLSLVGLGIWGQLPDKIHRLASLEVLDLSSNFLFGSIPPKMSRLAQLQNLMINDNFLNDTFPDWLDSLSNLTVLSLKRNQLRGWFSSSICLIRTLTDLALSQNELSGNLPDLGTLTNLHVLDLRENRLDSELPIMPKGLVTALLSKNSFSGKIPEQFSELNQLQHLDLSFNFLNGNPPSELFSLANISYLDLASNKLSGSLLNHLTCGSHLGFVDISNNKFIGKVPSCLTTTSDKRVVKFSGNCFSIDTPHQHPESYCKEAHVERKHFRGKHIGILVGSIVGIGFALVLLALGIVILYRKYNLGAKLEHQIEPKIMHENSPAVISSELLANARLVSQVAKLGTQVAPVYRLFSFEELKEATDNFDQSALVGEGAYGKIYKGRLEDGTCVAIRRVALYKRYSIQSLKLRLDLLSKLHHPHLVLLLGHCIDGGGGSGPDDFSADTVFLIYEYVANPNFRSHLSDNCPEKILNWSDRLAVLIGVAKAVHFLHTGVIPGSFNNRLKTNNVLLDEHRIAKLSDYGLSIIVEENEKIEAKVEAPNARQITKSEDDVYNFGLILLESLVGPIVSGREAYLVNEMASFGSQDGRRRIVDPVVLTTSSQESLSIVIAITNKCISCDASARPSFEEVLWNLQYAAQVQAIADSDQKSDQ